MRFTPKEFDKLMTEHFVILVDTQEKVNKHITDYFDEHKIMWKSKAFNASKDEGRVFREFRRMYGGVRNYLIVEDTTIEDIIQGNYRSNMNSTAVLRTVLSLQIKNGLTPLFVKKETTPKIIYELCLNALKAHIAK